MKNKSYIKYLSLLSMLVLIFLSGCMKPVDIDVEVVPDQPNIKGVSVGVMGTNNLFNEFALSKLEIDVTSHTVSVWVVTFRSMDDIWVSVKLEPGCKIEPLDGAPEFGRFGDYSNPHKYLVTAASGAKAEWTVDVQQDPNMPDISCLADFWTGDGVKAYDVTYPGYSPTSVVTEKIDCNHFKITMDFWQDANAVITLDLEVGEPDPSTFKGEVTLLNDVEFSSWEYDMKYTAGPAGSYDLNTFTLTFDAAFEGYGSSYPFNIYKE